MELDKIERKKLKTVIFTTNNLKIEGEIFTSPEIRLIDDFNASHRKFIAIANAKVYISYESDNAKYEINFLILNKDEIICAFPLE